MTNKSEVISDDNGVTVSVEYDYIMTLGYYEEISNPATWIEPTTYTEIRIVEVVIANVGIDITGRLNEKQKEFIISKLTY